MRTDAECRAAYLQRQIDSLREAPEVRAVERRGERRLIVLLQARYLGIVRGAPEAMVASGEDALEARLRIGFWQPTDPDDVQPVERVLAIGVELLSEDRGRPGLLLLPGPYPPVAHPHLTPTLPGGICLLDEWRIDRTNLGQVFRTLAMMLRFEAGTYSLSEERALAPGVARWLRAGAIGRFELPLARPTPPGIRVLASGGERDGGRAG